MEYYKTVNGFDIFTERESKKFVVCMDTPDGCISCNQRFGSYQEVLAFLNIQFA